MPTRAKKPKPDRRTRASDRPCPSCGHRREKPDADYCRACDNALKRAWREQNPLTGEALKRQQARLYAMVCKAGGELKPQPCLVCGACKSEMHHPDHELPRLVVWLCRRCHLAWHAHWRITVRATWEAWSRPRRLDPARGGAR
jgi:hypothetical protein